MSSSHPSALQWPPLPRTIELRGGWVKVQRPYKLGKKFADWEETRRIIRIERGLSRELAWRYLFHELTHAWLDDSRLFYGTVEVLALTEDQEEAICDVVASNLHFEMRRRLEAEQALPEV